MQADGGPFGHTGRSTLVRISVARSMRPSGAGAVAAEGEALADGVGVTAVPGTAVDRPWSKVTNAYPVAGAAIRTRPSASTPVTTARCRRRTVCRTSPVPGGTVCATTAWRYAANWVSRLRASESMAVPLGAVLQVRGERRPGTVQPGLDRAVGYFELAGDVSHRHVGEVVQDHGPALVLRQAGQRHLKRHAVRVRPRRVYLALGGEE